MMCQQLQVTEIKQHLVVSLLPMRLQRTDFSSP